MTKMATVEMNTASTKGGQKEKTPPSEEYSPPVLNEVSVPLNFSELTPSQFGISVQSFTPFSSNSKDKSRLAQMKARRRSNIGARGSPETNSLIRFMARQRMKTPTTFQTPESVRNSPFPPRVASTLRQKMASFQSLMDVEEKEVCDPTPRQDNNTGGCIKTRDYLSDGNNHYGEKENHPPMTTPIPSKRRCLGPLGGCEVEIREASAPILHFSLKEQQEEEEPVMQLVTQGPLPSSKTVEEAQAVLMSPALHVDFKLEACSPAKNQQDGAFELQSLGRPPPDDPAAASPARPASPFHIPSLPSLLEMKPTGEDDSSGTSTVKEKKKRVRFAGPLSPEFFDKNLPPSTPLKKGGTPARAPTPGGSLQPRSVLKTPQRSESQTPRAQPDLSSPTVFGASPTLAIPRSRKMHPVGEDGKEKNEERLIVFPSMEDIDSEVTRETECMWDAQPLNLDTAFYEESLCQSLTESETKASTTSQMDALDEPTSLPEKEKQHEAGVEAPDPEPDPDPAPDPAPSRSRRKKQPGPEHDSSNEAPARSSSRKRKQPEESEPVKRSTRSAAKSASGRMKMTSAATRRWNRDVDRSLYGSREYASKNPTLSPITERLSLISQSAAAQQPVAKSCTAPNHEVHLNPEMAINTQAMGDFTLTKAVENPSEDSITSPNSNKERSTGKSRRLSGPRVRGRGLKNRKVSISDDVPLSEETADQTEEHCEDQTTTNPEASRGTPLHHTAPEQGEVHTEPDAQTDSDSDGKLQCHGCLVAPTSDCPPSAEESSNTLSLPAEPAAQRRAKRGRRSSVNSSVLHEKGNQAEEHQTGHEVEETLLQGDRAASQQEDNIRPSPESQEEDGAAEVQLAPWQADFNFEDVFKPVATRGQRSVRRSLRNRSNAGHSSNSAGLAWLVWTSPDSSKEARRRTRGLRLSAALPVPPSLPEETHDHASCETTRTEIKGDN